MRQQITKRFFKLGVTLFLGLICFMGVTNPVQAVTTESGLQFLKEDSMIVLVDLSAEIADQISMDTEKETLNVRGLLPEKEGIQLSVGTEVTEKIKWRSSNPSIAAIDIEGRLRILKAGEAKISATGLASKVTKIIAVKIQQVPAEKIAISVPESTQMTIGTKLTLKTTVMPGGSTEQKMKWQSSDSKVASVDQQGIVRARKAGKVTITAKVNEQLSDSLVLTVVPVQPLPNIQLYELNAQGEKGAPFTLNRLDNPLLLEPGQEKKFWVEAIVKKNEIQDYETKVKWSCLKGDTNDTSYNIVQIKVNPKKAETIDHNQIYNTVLTIKANKKSNIAGEQVRIETTNVRNHPALYVQVAAAQPQSMEISKLPKQLEVGKTTVLKAKVKPALADQTVFWESSDPTVATIEAETGLVKAINNGTVTFTAKTRQKNSSGIPYLTVKTDLTTKWKLRSATLNTKTIYLQPGESYNSLKVLMEPSGSRKVTFSSVQSSIATVNDNGVVTAEANAKKGAKTTIRAIIGDKEKTLSCKVVIGQGKNDDPNRIPNALEEVKAGTTSYKMNIGQSRKLSYRLVPSKTNQRQVRWASLDAEVATVDSSGRVMAVGQSEKSSTQIVGTFENGQKLTYTITIKPAMTLSTDGNIYERKLSPLALKRNEVATVHAQVRPSTKQQLSWQTSSKYIVIQDNKDGSVTVKSVLPSNKRSASATIRVKDSVSGKYLSFRIKLN